MLAANASKIFALMQVCRLIVVQASQPVAGKLQCLLEPLVFGDKLLFVLVVTPLTTPNHPACLYANQAVK